MLKHPKITVLMAVFNGAKFLEQSMPSVLGQTFRDFEFLVIDDGSNDASASILSRYKCADPRIRVIRQENSGLTRALQLGLREAKGEYVVRQDVDDISHFRRLEVLFPKLQCDTLVLSGWINRSEGQVYQSWSSLALKYSPRLMRKFIFKYLNIAAHGTYAFHKEYALSLGGYREFFYAAQDYDLLLRYLDHGLIVVPDNLYELSLHQGSISRSSANRQKTYALIAALAYWARKENSSDLREGESTEEALKRLSEKFPLRALIINGILSLRYKGVS